jgi:hypothetical protein
MALDDRHARLGDLLPAQLARALVETGDDEFVFGLIEHRTNVAVETDLQLRIRRAADGARGADMVAPHNRARMTETRHRHAPFHQLRFRHVPLHRYRLAIVHAARRNAAEPRPIHTGTRRRLSRCRCRECHSDYNRYKISHASASLITDADHGR